MKYQFWVVLILLLSVSLFGCIDRGNEAQLKQDGQPLEKQQQTDENKEDTMLPVFKGTVFKISDKNPQIEVPEDAWLAPRGTLGPIVHAALAVPRDIKTGTSIFAPIIHPAITGQDNEA